MKSFRRIQSCICTILQTVFSECLMDVSEKHVLEVEDEPVKNQESVLLSLCHLASIDLPSSTTQHLTEGQISHFGRCSQYVSTLTMQSNGFCTFLHRKPSHSVSTRHRHFHTLTASPLVLTITYS